MMWKNVYKLMKEKEWNQNQLAKKAGVNNTVISALKNGKIKKPSFDLACKLADALEVSLDDLRKDDKNEFQSD
ncbi:Helix-turn-helix [Alkalibacterium putridalgicola]|uniref:Helix-turn-helix n=1 Tax=Alkalibacterium putridalgicola TaxID=426703 RepID=A0A1H7RPN0_9LACT|nr:helix-turn-helix transcriptional regulator [Alkalibacterium putridalgicola]GEK88916.1 transcriptional regulator [Alkalibacterium putridalgicola]SEL61764.1 Helix-turn-helix [Alkalibacterium putridalgicola]